MPLRHNVVPAILSKLLLYYNGTAAAAAGAAGLERQLGHLLLPNMASAPSA
jgi:hypothetical protein